MVINFYSLYNTWTFAITISINTSEGRECGEGVSHRKRIVKRAMLFNVFRYPLSANIEKIATPLVSLIFLIGRYREA